MINYLPMLHFRSFSSDDQRTWDLTRDRRIPWKTIAVGFIVVATIIAAVHSG